jgi:hypothetical protein
MATQILGTARIAYTAVGATAATTVLLGTPLHDLRPGEDRWRAVSDSVNRGTRETAVIGGRRTIDGLTRFNDDPNELQNAVINGRDGQPWTYYHGSTYAGIGCTLIDGGDIEPDAEPVAPHQYQSRVTLRLSSSSADWSAIL